MSNRTKTIIGAILVFLSSIFGWYVAFSDGDDSTKPDTEAVVEAGEELYDAVKSEDEKEVEDTTEKVTE
jgi:hypothetical protein